MCTAPKGTQQISTDYLEYNRQAEAWRLQLKSMLIKIVLKHSKQKKNKAIQK